MSWLTAFASPSEWGIAIDGSPELLGGDALPAAGHELTMSSAPGLAISPGNELDVCRVSGGALDAVGVRLDRPGRGVESVRVFAACFSAEHAVALVAVRPAGAKGQDRDVVAAASLGEREGLSVFDPRLSTTYAPDGAPLRAGVELWLGEGEDEEDEQYPHRVAGESTGDRAVSDELGLCAYGLRCHSRGEQGRGVYVLLRPV